MRKHVTKKERFTKQQILLSMWNTGGIVYDMAKELKTNTKVIYDYLIRHPELAIEKKLIEEAILDMAESKLIKKIKEGDLSAIKFYLYTKGKHRGYTSKLIVEGTENANNQLPQTKSIDFSKIPTDVLQKFVDGIEEAKDETEEAA